MDIKPIEKQFLDSLRFPKKPIMTDTRTVEGKGVTGIYGLNIVINDYDDRLGEALALSLSEKMRRGVENVMEKNGAEPDIYVGPDEPRIFITIPGSDTVSCGLSPKEDNIPLIDDPLLKLPCPVMKYKVHATIEFLIA
jgi:hypothetical protein